jgi:hypothetical protein
MRDSEVKNCLKCEEDIEIGYSPGLGTGMLEKVFGV